MIRIDRDSVLPRAHRFAALACAGCCALLCGWLVPGELQAQTRHGEARTGADAAEPAHAVTAADAGGATRTIVVTQPAETHRVRLGPGGAVTLSFDSPLIRVKHRTHRWIKATQTGNGMTFTADPRLKPAQIPGFLIFFAQHHTIHVVLDPPSITPEGFRQDSTIVVKHSCQLDAIWDLPRDRRGRPRRFAVEKAALDDEESTARQVLEHRENMADGKPAEDPGSAGSGEQWAGESAGEETGSEAGASEPREADQWAWNAVARAVHQGHTSHPVALGDCETGQVFLCGLRWGQVGDDGVLRVLIDNSSFSPVTITGISVFDDRTAVDRVRALYIDGRSAENPAQDVLLTIPPRTRVEGSILVRDPGTVDGLLKVVVEGPSRVLHAAQWIDLQRPAKPEEPEREKALGIHGAGGVIWLRDEFEGRRSKPTDTAGAGLWLLYAWSEHVHVQLDAMGLSTGEVRFADTTVNGVQGELTRSAKVARVQGSGVLRLGTRGIMPFLRLGVGVQILSYSETFSAGEPPESSLEAGVLFGGGGGAQLRLGSRVIAGVELGFAAELGGGAPHLQGGIHLGYTWQPAESDR